MDKPVLVVNFKTYAESRAKHGVNLAKLADQVAKEYSVDFIVVPQLVNMATIAETIDIPVFSQHLDPLPSGSATGHVDAYSLKEAGISGTLLNHSEKRLGISILEESVNLSNKLNLKTIICAGTITLSKAVSNFGPWAVAMEPPELIGGDVSVTTQPQVVIDAAKSINDGNPDVIPLTGAGVKTAEHVGKAIELGTRGVLLASGIVKAKDPLVVMSEMAKVMIKY